MHRHADGDNAAQATPWHRQGVVWLGVLVFVASVAGCVWIIMAGLRHTDVPLATGQHAVFGVPATTHSAAPPPAASAP